MIRILTMAAAVTLVMGITSATQAQNPQRKPGVGPNGQPLRPGMSPNMQARPGQPGAVRPGGVGNRQGQGGQFGGAAGQQRPKPYEVTVSYEAKPKKPATEVIKVMAADETQARTIVTAQYSSKVKKFEIVDVKQAETRRPGEGKRSLDGKNPPEKKPAKT